MSLATDTAWAAGLFEGEGCISISRNGPAAGRVTLGMKMTDRDIVERFHKVIGCGVVYEDRWYRRRGQRPQFKWHAGARADVRNVMRLLLPYFGVRRAAKVEEALTFL